MPLASFGDTWDMKKTGVWARGCWASPSWDSSFTTFVARYKGLIMALIFHHSYPVILEPEVPREGKPVQGQSFPLSHSPPFPLTPASAAALSSSSLSPSPPIFCTPYFSSTLFHPKLPTLPTDLLPGLPCGWAVQCVRYPRDMESHSDKRKNSTAVSCFLVFRWFFFGFGGFFPNPPIQSLLPVVPHIRLWWIVLQNSLLAEPTHLVWPIGMTLEKSWTSFPPVTVELWHLHRWQWPWRHIIRFMKTDI